MVSATSASHQVRNVLRITYGLLPLVAGADKFLHVLTHWEKYLYSGFPELLSLQPHTFMLIVGVIEIIAGIIVLVKPKIGGMIVGFWLLAIVVNLFLKGEYYDIALRDLGLSIGAFMLARLSYIPYDPAIEDDKTTTTKY
jgi:uncharacterized membrane protein YphA (DoxX/SURF4 family)